MALVIHFLNYAIDQIEANGLFSEGALSQVHFVFWLNSNFQGKLKWSYLFSKQKNLVCKLCSIDPNTRFLEKNPFFFRQ